MFRDLLATCFTCHSGDAHIFKTFKSFLPCPASFLFSFGKYFELAFSTIHAIHPIRRGRRSRSGSSTGREVDAGATFESWISHFTSELF